VKSGQRHLDHQKAQDLGLGGVARRALRFVADDIDADQRFTTVFQWQDRRLVCGPGSAGVTELACWFTAIEPSSNLSRIGTDLHYPLCIQYVYSVKAPLNRHGSNNLSGQRPIIAEHGVLQASCNGLAELRDRCLSGVNQLLPMEGQFQEGGSRYTEQQDTDHDQEELEV
jgi:hypothetical protein